MRSIIDDDIVSGGRSVPLFPPVAPIVVFLSNLNQFGHWSRDSEKHFLGTRKRKETLQHRRILVVLLPVFHDLANFLHSVDASGFLLFHMFYYALWACKTIWTFSCEHQKCAGTEYCNIASNTLFWNAKTTGQKVPPFLCKANCVNICSSQERFCRKDKHVSASTQRCSAGNTRSLLHSNVNILLYKAPLLPCMNMETCCNVIKEVYRQQQLLWEGMLFLYRKHTTSRSGFMNVWKEVWSRLWCRLWMLVRKSQHLQWCNILMLVYVVPSLFCRNVRMFVEEVLIFLCRI